ncbi:MAG: nucleoside deaminase [Bacteroidales bacterium]|jgi:tRNA(Arg) A34 adenosine deaminase TadA|nr:nucleoside deaminase [Bacteroidales bacterium]
MNEIEMDTNIKQEDAVFMRHAVGIAKAGIDKGCGPFGAVIAREGRLIAEANNEVVNLHDPTAHAEILAIREASELLGCHDLSDCVLYSSCEPCPMCFGAIYWAGIRTVFFASDRTDAERSGFSDKMIYDEIALDPHDRKISFVKMSDAGGDEVFRKWDSFESRIPY